jgi:hypothetical protein
MFVSIVCLISCINDEQLSQPTITFVGWRCQACSCTRRDSLYKALFL